MRTPLCVVALAVFTSNAASAQVVLTEAEALARLAAESPRVRALRIETDRARADVLAAARFPNPRVTLGREAVAGVAEDFVLIAQSLPVTGRRRFEIQAAEAGVLASEFRVTDLERGARAELRLAFTRLRQAQVREEELMRTARDLRELADILAKREQAGDAAGFDRLRAEREVLDVEADVTEAQAARAQAQAELAAFFATAVDLFTLRVAREPGAPRALPTADELIAQAGRSRGELLALDQDLQAARFARQAASRRNVPEPEIIAGMKTSNVGGGDQGSVFSVLFAVPLVDRSRAEHARADVRARQAQARLDLLRAQLRAEIPAWRDIVARRRSAADSYRTAAVARSDELRRIARVSYDAGERTILELLDTYRSASAARERSAQLDALMIQAEIQLEYLTGWESVR